MILECNAKFSFYDYYDQIWDRFYTTRANDNTAMGPEWFFAGIERKLNRYNGE